MVPDLSVDLNISLIRLSHKQSGPRPFSVLWTSGKSIWSRAPSGRQKTVGQNRQAWVKLGHMKAAVKSPSINSQLGQCCFCVCVCESVCVYVNECVFI